MVANASRVAGDRRTPDELRERREQFAARIAIDNERRRLEDDVREERRDATAKTICARWMTERRRYRSDVVLRAQREQLLREWNARSRSSRTKTKSKAR
jgi:hypothetical protein